MTIFKRFVFCIALLLVPVALSAQALPKETSYYRPHYQRLQRIGTNPLRLSVQSVTQTKSAILKSSTRGDALEPVARNVYKNFLGKKWKSVDATYYQNGGHLPEPKAINQVFGQKQGLDGLFVYKKNGTIRGVRVVEIKSGNAKLKKNANLFDVEKSIENKKIADTGETASQLSDKYNLNRIDMSIAQKQRASDLKVAKTAQETEELEKAIKDLEDTKEAIENGINVEKYEIDITYDNGRLKVTQQEYKSIDQNKVKEIGKLKTLTDFSYLEKDIAKLSKFEKCIRDDFLKSVENAIRDNKELGLSENQIAKIMQDFKTGKINANDLEKSGVSIEKLREDSYKKVSSLRAEKQLKLQKGMKAGFALLAVASEVASIYQWQTGSMSTSEFVFDSIANAASLGMLFIKAIGNSNPITTIIFCAIDTAKNFWAWRNGRMSTSDFVIESVANTIGLVVATIVAGAVGGIAAIASLNPILGAIIGFAVFTAVYTVTKWIVKLIGRAIVDHYEAIKQPEHFRIVCDDVRRVCNL